jgi:hypothetical protein
MPRIDQAPWYPCRLVAVKSLPYVDIACRKTAPTSWRNETPSWERKAVAVNVCIYIYIQFVRWYRKLREVSLDNSLARAHKISKNVAATAKFYATEVLNEESSILRAHKD